MKNTKKLFLSILSMSALMVSACSNGVVDTSSSAPSPTPSSSIPASSSEPAPSSSEIEEVTITLDKTTATISVNEVLQLTATASSGTVVWSSSNVDVATVSDGTVTAVSEGYARIYASVGEVSVSCAVLVEAEPSPDPTPGPEPTPTPVEAVGGIVIKNGETWDDPISVKLYNNPDNPNEVMATNVQLEKDQVFYINFDTDAYRHYNDLKVGGASASFAAEGDDLNFKALDAGVYSFYIEREFDPAVRSVWIEGVKTAPVFDKYTVSFGEEGTPIELTETTLDSEEVGVVLKKYTADIPSLKAGDLIQFKGGEDKIAPGDENEAGKEHNGNNTIGTYPYYYVHNDATDAKVYLKTYANGYSFWLTGYNAEAEDPEVPENPKPIEQEALYYLVGVIGGKEDWASYEHFFSVNAAQTEAEEYYIDDVELKTGDKLKVMSSTNAYYPDGTDNEYVITADGTYDIYFRPAGNADWTQGGGYFFIGKNTEPTPEPGPEPAPTETMYYLKGSMNGWKEDANYVLVADEEDASKHYIKLNLSQGDEFKLYSTAGENGTWFPTEAVPYKHGDDSALANGYLTQLTGDNIAVVVPGYYFIEVKVSGEGAGIWTSLEKDEDDPEKLLLDSIVLNLDEDILATEFKKNEEGVLQFECAKEGGYAFAKDAKIECGWASTRALRLTLGDSEATEALLSLGEDNYTLTVKKAANINFYFVLGAGTVTLYAAEAGGTDPVVPVPTEVTYAATINEEAVSDLASKAIDKESNTWAYRFNELKAGDKVAFTADTEALKFVHYDQEAAKVVEDGAEYTVAADGDYSFYYKAGEGIYVAKAAEQLKGVVTLYFSNAFGGDAVNAYAWNNADDSKKNADWPGVAMTDTGKVNEYNQKIYSVEIDLSKYDRLILNGNNKQTVDMDISALTVNAFYLDGTKDSSDHYNYGMWNYVPAEE